MKTLKIIYWSSTCLIFLFQGVMPALTGHSEMARQGILHLGYPEYFLPLLNIFKILGAFALIVPMFPKRLKEWAYAGFTFDFMFASLSIYFVDGFSIEVFYPFIALGILLTSYFSYHKLQNRKRTENYRARAI